MDAAFASADCKVCGQRVTMLEAPLHIEDHRQRGDLERARAMMQADELAQQGSP